MSDNPYRPPGPDSVAVERISRATARRWARGMIAALLGPAIYNIGCFWWFSGGWSRGQFWVLTLWLTVLALVVWRLMVSLVSDLETVTHVLHALFGRSETADDWQQAAYRSLARLRLVAVPGALLWAGWCYAFYQWQLPFYLISVPAGCVAHMLAACAWLPLLVQWVRIERTGGPR